MGRAQGQAGAGGWRPGGGVSKAGVPCAAAWGDRWTPGMHRPRPAARRLLTSHQGAAEGPSGPHSRRHGRWSRPETPHRPLGAASEAAPVRGRQTEALYFTARPSSPLQGLRTHHVPPALCQSLSQLSPSRTEGLQRAVGGPLSQGRPTG